MDDEEREHLQNLLQSYRRRLRPLEQREAQLGPRTPPEVLVEIEDIQVRIAEIEVQLGTRTPPAENTLDANHHQHPAQAIELQGTLIPPSISKSPAPSSSRAKRFIRSLKDGARFWQRLRTRYKVIAVLLIAMIIGLVSIRYTLNHFRCQLMTYTGEKCFQVYTDSLSINNHFFPSGFMGDIKDFKLEQTTEDVHSGTTSIKMTYEPSGKGVGWTGVVWQFPANNWGTLKDGVDLRGSRYVTFWAKSSRPNQSVRFGVGGLGRKPGTCERDSVSPYPESLCPTVEVTCNLTNQWFRFAIPIPEDRDLQHVVSGFSWTASRPVTFYLDDIFWVANPASLPWEGPLICSSVS